MNTTKQVVEIRPEKKKNSGPYGIWTHDHCDTSAVLYQLSWQANWELVTILDPNKPSKKNWSCFRKKNRGVIWFNVTWLTVLLTMLHLFRMSSICLIIYFGVLACNILSLRQLRRKQQTFILTNLRLCILQK